MTTTPDSIVIVGAGVGGLTVARHLAPHSSRFHVTVIDPSPTHDFAPSFLWMLSGDRTSQQVSRSLQVVETWGIDRIQRRVTALDANARLLNVESGDSIPFDTLVLAPGAELAMGSVPGLAQHAFSFYTRSEAERLATELQGFAGGRVLLTVPSMPYKCPAAPYEAALLVDALLAKRGVEYKIEIFTVEPQPLPVAGPKIGARVRSVLDKRRIVFRPQSQLQSVEERQAIFEHGVEQFDMLITIPPHQAPEFVRTSSLAGPNGWIPVDRRTMKAADNVYALGDVTAIMLDNGKPLPKAGVFAHSQAKAVANNLIAHAEGKQQDQHFLGHGACFLEIGYGKAGFASGNFYATPDPRVRMFPPSRLGHMGKVMFERRWLNQFRAD